MKCRSWILMSALAGCINTVDTALRPDNVNPPDVNSSDTDAADVNPSDTAAFEEVSSEPNFAARSSDQSIGREGPLSQPEKPS